MIDLKRKTRGARANIVFAAMQVLTPNLRKDIKDYLTYVNKVPRPFTMHLKEYFGDKPVSGMEIGFGYGDNAESLLSELNVKALYCVDPFEPYTDLLGLSDYSDDVNGLREKLSSDSRVHFIKARSDDAFKHGLVPNKLDFIYVDGYHGTDQAYRDIVHSLKVSNIVGGHDFTRLFELTVMPAVFQASADLGLVPTVKMPDFWFHIVR